MNKKTIGISISGLLLLLAFVYIIWRTLPVAPLTEIPGTGIENTLPEDVQVETVATGLNVPWSIAFLPSGEIIFSERDGLIKSLNPETSEVNEIGELPVSALGEGGFLGIALHPDFEENNHLFMYYTYREDEDFFNKIVRAKLVDDRLSEETDILTRIPASSIHNGGRLAFGPDEKLYITAGDASQENLAQDKESLAGKILRINADGSIPDDNPFEDSPVFSLGHRNPQGLAWDSEGTLYASEHGPQGHDEINIIEAGKNYGWPEIKGEFDTVNGRPPVLDYRNPIIESSVNTWAPSGTAFNDGSTLPRSFNNRLFFTGLRSKSLWRFNPRSKSLEKLYENDYGRLRDVAIGPDGFIYFSTSNRDGRGSPVESDDRILRITPK